MYPSLCQEPDDEKKIRYINDTLKRSAAVTCEKEVILDKDLEEVGRSAVTFALCGA